MSGQRTPPSALQPLPSPSRSRTDPASSHRPRRQNKVSSGSPPAELPTSSSPQNPNPAPQTRALPTAPNSSTDHKESRRSPSKAPPHPTSPNHRTSTPSSYRDPKSEPKTRSKPRSFHSKTDTNPSLSSPSAPSPPITSQPSNPLSTSTALAGTHLLTHPLHQLSLLLSLALSAPSPPSNQTQAPAQAPLHFTRTFTTATIRSITSLHATLLDLHVSLAAALLPTLPSSPEQWLSLTNDVTATISSDPSPSSQLLRIAAHITQLDTERSWRCWWYWRATKEQERAQDQDQYQTARATPSATPHSQEKPTMISPRHPRDSDTNTEELSLAMHGTALPTLTSHWRSMSSAEKSAAERAFYAALHAALQVLPPASSTAPDRQDTAQMARAIATSEELRAREEAAWERREGEREREHERDGDERAGGCGGEQGGSTSRSGGGSGLSREQEDTQKRTQKQRPTQRSGAVMDRDRTRRAKVGGSLGSLSRGANESRDGGSRARDMHGDRRCSGSAAIDGNRERRREVAY